MINYDSSDSSEDSSEEIITKIVFKENESRNEKNKKRGFLLKKRVPIKKTVLPASTKTKVQYEDNHLPQGIKIHGFIPVQLLTKRANLPIEL